MKRAKIYDARHLPVYLTPDQCAALLGVTEKTVRQMCQRGKLPAFKVGPKLWRIDKDASLAQWRNEAGV